MLPRVRAVALVPAILLSALTLVGCSSPTGPSDMSSVLAMTCPAPTSTQSLDGKPVSVVYLKPTVTGGISPRTLSCTPESGSLFPVGATPVTCTVTDATPVTRSCTFTVTVNVPKSTTFLAFGDSITEGKLANGTFVSNTYPIVLQQLLSSRYPAQTFDIRNAGCGGEKAAADPTNSLCPGGVARLPTMLTLYSPQILLLLEGVNDLSGASGDTAAISPMIDALRTMVHQAKSVGVQVYLATLLPERAGDGPGLRNGALPLISPANAQIRQLASSEGVVLVDLFQGFGGSPDPYIDTDGLHPNEQGYQKIAQIFFDVLRSKLDSSSFVVQNAVPSNLFARR